MKFGRKEPELFNLAEDPHEEHDLTKQHPEKLSELAARLQEAEYRSHNLEAQMESLALVEQENQELEARVAALQAAEKRNKELHKKLRRAGRGQKDSQ